jgi:hypothetical protein
VKVSHFHLPVTNVIGPLCGGIAAATFLLVQPMAGLAQAVPPLQARLSDSQRQQLFEARRTLEKRSHAGRIAILQEADRCITAATSPQSYRLCEQQEQQARQALRASLKAERQAMRRQFGLPEKAPKP